MIGVTQAEAVMTIELQRPERRNALNSQLVEELREALQKASEGSDGATRAIVLTGQGTVFCAGADLSGDAFAADYPDRLIELHKAMDAAPMPIIGAINGPAIGAGLQLAMQCDLRVVAAEAFFQFPTSKYGLALDNWSIRRLSSLVGHGRARAMLLTAEKLSAETALQTGMANRIGTLAGCPGLGGRDLRAGTAGDSARQTGAQRRRLYRGRVAGAQGALRQSVGQPGRHRSAGRSRGETAAEVPGGLTVRGALRLAAGTATLAGGGWVLRALHGAPAALGADPTAIQAAAAGSPNFHDGVFANLEPGSAASGGEMLLIAREFVDSRGTSRPAGPIPLAAPEICSGPDELGACQLAVTWFGHSSVLVEIDGYRVLTDPVWSDRCSPSAVVGPQRLHPPPVEVEGLPALDAVVISHDHYDHLDIDTIVALGRSQRAPFFVPLGVGAHLRAWGIPEKRIVELDWNQSSTVGELTVICLPARHFSGRLFHRNNTLWASWGLIGPSHRAYFGGDTGYTKSFAQIGADHGPFDLTLLPIGAYNAAFTDVHMNPEEAVQAHLDVSDSGSGLLGADPLGNVSVGAASVG